MGTSRIASRSTFLSSKFRILKASSRDIFTFMALAFTAALCLASASQQRTISVGGCFGAKQGTPDSQDARVSRGVASRTYHRLLVRVENGPTDYRTGYQGDAGQG